MSGKKNPPPRRRFFLLRLRTVESLCDGRRGKEDDWAEGKCQSKLEEEEGGKKRADVFVVVVRWKKKGAKCISHFPFSFPHIQEKKIR